MAGWQRQPALVRAVNSMMRALGGATISLRFPAASDGGTQRELGITAATLQEAELGPVVVRESAESADKRVRGTQPRQIEALISSSTLDARLPAFGMNDGLSFLRHAQQLVYGGLVFTVTSVSAERFAGVTYMYRVAAVSNQ